MCVPGAQQRREVVLLQRQSQQRPCVAVSTAFRRKKLRAGLRSWSSTATLTTAAHFWMRDGSHPARSEHGAEQVGICLQKAMQRYRNRPVSQGVCANQQPAHLRNQSSKGSSTLYTPLLPFSCCSKADVNISTPVLQSHVLFAAQACAIPPYNTTPELDLSIWGWVLRVIPWPAVVVLRPAVSLGDIPGCAPTPSCFV